MAFTEGFRVKRIITDRSHKRQQRIADRLDKINFFQRIWQYERNGKGNGNGCWCFLLPAVNDDDIVRPMIP